MNNDTKISLVKLVINSNNWITYHNQLQFALSLCKLIEHLTHDTVTIKYMNMGDINGMSPAEHWDNDKTIIKYLITLSVPDLVFNRIKEGAYAIDIWDILKKMFKGKSQNTLMDLTRRMQHKKYTDDGNIHMHFDQLVNICE